MGMFDQFADQYMEQKKADQEKGGYKILTEGKYFARLDEVKCDLTGALAKFTCVYKVIQSEDGDFEFKGEMLFKNYSMSEKGAVWFMKDLEIMGVSIEGIDGPEKCHAEMNELAGKTAVLYCKPKEYNGKTYNNCYLNEFDVQAPIPNHAPKPVDFDPNEEVPF